jgi:hypothetical protein
MTMELGFLFFSFRFDIFLFDRTACLDGFSGNGRWDTLNFGIAVCSIAFWLLVVWWDIRLFFFGLVCGREGSLFGLLCED